MLGILIGLMLSVTPPEGPTDTADCARQTFAPQETDLEKAPPEAVLALARCHESLARPAEAIVHYRHYLRRAPEALDHRLEVAERLAVLSARLAQLNLGVLELETGALATLSVAGEQFQGTRAAVALPEGEHEVIAQFGDRRTAQKVRVVRGELSAMRLEVPVALLPPTPSLLASPQPVLAPVRQQVDPPVPRLRTAAYVTLAATAVVLATGAVMGALSNFEVARLRDEHRHLSYAQATAIAQQAGLKGRAANWLLAGGAVGALAGAGMFAWSLPDGAKP